MRGINKQAMLDLIIEAKRNEPEDVRFSDWLAEYLADRLSTLPPPNEPLTCEGCAEDGKWEWEWEYQNGAECPCAYCKRRAADCYRRPPEVSP